ncbi:MAG: hypothetical protein II443_00690, partial [Oscillospiraceae bacterium]|nr:hypothetical protein [Oscillospiraceae bacterium]
MDEGIRVYSEDTAVSRNEAANGVAVFGVRGDCRHYSLRAVLNDRELALVLSVPRLALYLDYQDTVYRIYRPDSVALAGLDALVSYILDNIPDTSALFVTTIPDVDPNRREVYDWFGNYRHSADWQTQYDDTTAEKNIHSAVEKYNSDIKKLTAGMAKADSRVHFADVNSAVTNVKKQLGDGVHPNEDGYKAMGEYWTGVISRYISGEPAVT